MKKVKTAGAEWPNQTDPSQIYTPVYLKDTDYWLMMQLTARDK